MSYILGESSQFVSITLLGNLDKTSRARAGHPALKCACAVVKYSCLSKGVILSSKVNCLSGCDFISVP